MKEKKYIREEKCENCNQQSFKRGSWYYKNREKMEHESEFIRPHGLLCEICFQKLSEEDKKKWQFRNKNI